MARYRAAGRPKLNKDQKRRGLFSCVVLIAAAFVLINLLFYFMLRSSRP